MDGFFGIYKAHLKVDAALMTQYRIATLLAMLQIIAEPIIYLSVWRAVAAARDGEVNGYTIEKLATYYLIFLFVRQFVAATGFWLFERRIRQGTLSILLLRPVHPIHADIAENISFKLFYIIILVPIYKRHSVQYRRG